MSRLIDLDDSRNCYIGMDGECEQWNIDPDVLAEVQPEQRWIPVSERLPDVVQRVLLSGHGRVMVGMLHSFGKYSLEPTGISYVYPKDDIEAWMPLPDPWKEGEVNE